MEWYHKKPQGSGSEASLMARRYIEENSNFTLYVNTRTSICSNRIIGTYTQLKTDYLRRNNDVLAWPAYLSCKEHFLDPHVRFGTKPVLMKTTDTLCAIDTAVNPV